MSNFVCPQCRGELHEVEVHSRGAHPFTVEQCKRCGGVWFDKFEHHRVHGSEVDVLDPLDEEAFGDFDGESVPLALCPKDGTELVTFTDYNFPRNLRIDHCFQCEGMWFNRGDFRNYREEYERRKKKLEEKEEDKHKSTKSQALTMAYLTHDSAMRKKEKMDEAKKIVSKEIMYSSLAFIFMKKPSSAIVYIPLIAQSLWVLFTKLFGAFDKDGKVYIDFDEFKELLEEVSKNEGI